MLDIISLGDYYAPINETDGLPNLRPDVNTICREKFRRIDRFIQLCLLGSARCMQAIESISHNSRTGLYIGSRFAAMSNTIEVQEQMFLHGQAPKPVNFINTLSNSAGYYVARNLQLKGKNLFVSRQNASLEAALSLAQLDLQSGQIEQALVGVVDEGVLPLADHCQRMGIPANTAIGEGSHWFLLRPTSKTQALATITDIDTFHDQSDLQTWLSDKATLRNHFIYCDRNVKTSKLINDLPMENYKPALQYYPSRTGGVLLRFIQTHKKQALITICADEAGRFHVTRTIVHG